MKSLGRRGRTSAAILGLAATAVSLAPRAAMAQIAVSPDVAALAKMPVVDSSSLRRVIGHLAGRSGKLLAHFVLPPRTLSIPVIAGGLAYTSKAIPQIQEVRGASRIGQFSMITMRSFRDKIAGSVGSYRIGFWPEERGRLRSEAYENPEGFIEVTPQNQDTRISEHFRLRDFLTHDQQNVWPKYLVLREPLIDKLELVIADLTVHGVPASNVIVMSGFRTPHHNQYGVGEDGGARDSRHQFGDGADIIIDSNRDGRMDDLNFDGRLDRHDAEEILHAVNRVERLYPDLVGGVGTYAAMGPSGPFAHIDVRGYRARWGGGSSAKRRVTSKPARAEVASTKGTCRATGASAVLCAVRGARRD